MEFSKLTVHCYNEDPKMERRVTLSPMNVAVVAAETEDSVVNGRSLRNVSVLFVDGGSLDLLLDHADMSMLESAIGSYCLG